MKLTGQAKELFRQYYEKLPPHTPNHVPYATFMGLHPSMQWGTLQDWAYSMDIVVAIGISAMFDNRYCIHFDSKRSRILPADMDNFEFLDEARNAAIEKLNELINNG